MIMSRINVAEDDLGWSMATPRRHCWVGAHDTVQKSSRRDVELSSVHKEELI